MSIVGGVILLSSSPPRLLARSPTPADNTASSPALPSPETIFASQRSKGSQNGFAAPWTGPTGLDRNRKFKTTSTFRERVGSGLSSSKKLPLKEKANKGNLPMVRRAQGLKKGLGSEKHYFQRPVSPEENRLGEKDKIKDVGTTRSQACDSSHHELKAQPKAAEAYRPREPSPLGLDKASSRRLDWTPPACHSNQNSPGTAPASFSENLLGSFGYNAAAIGPKDSLVPKDDSESNPTKRRKLDVVDVGALGTAAAMKASKLFPKPSRGSDEPARKRTRSPKKKSTTITGLATSHYFGEETSEKSPMMQYLSATQQRALGLDSDTAPDTAKRKGSAKNPKALKKAPRKSTLRSPQSAIKAFDDQDMLFGSASQLAGDESPMFIRDTVQAMKQSENTILISDPVSTQITIPTSEPAETPRRHHKCGVSRFVKSKNLWSVAGRDVDNALLQVDTVDMFDSPDLRTAFAGKDVLLEPGAPRFRDSTSPEKQVGIGQDPMRTCIMTDDCLSMGWDEGNLSSLHDSRGILDIDELKLKTPCAMRRPQIPVQVRALHAAAVGRTCTGQARGPTNKLSEAPAERIPNPQPIRPSFTGLTTNQLATQLAAYGFKPIKKREKMIEVLNRCWDDKHPSVSGADSVATITGETIETSHGDFLTKLHDVSARPTPKTKKPRGRLKSEGAGASSPENRSSKTSRTKKSAGEMINVDGNLPQEKTKKPSKSAQSRVKKAKEVTVTSLVKPQAKSPLKSRYKVNKATISDEPVMDVDDIESSDNSILDDVAQVQSCRTGVKRANTVRRHCSPTNPPSSYAFETASWLEQEPEASEPETTILEAAMPINGDTPKRAKTKVKPTAFRSSTATMTTPAAPLPVITANPSPSSPSQPALSKQITLAITTFQPPPSTLQHNSQQNPTFHQKILMYDPIILEDLAAWLNTEGFKCIGEDREVGPIEVREWCEDRGICCLWRGGWRGKSVKGARRQGRGKEIEEHGLE
ncbi:hypothetical protein EPUS_02850 [Endocarpon pusillum Z07020]|uniref:Structure-specific endonuclease subunit SLX4 n=1 Tax=Endocarpon pusillum (strain Z07020 / HMAS-L-300199) TaxID=1263415 RepID=U1GK60_ENDPU|nr:uncharacterized protein EPUS_02850 [Endocarpon pusillum Z07020]ERF72568.1 hypothetical protein EPUS_02850 [Endocarpon pusillum Z07020]